MANNIKTKYKRKNSLIRMKYLEYVPILFITNMSTLLIMTVDGIVVGNYMGGMALAAVNMFNPVAVLLSAYMAIIAHGIADCFADALVSNNPIEKIHNCQATKFVIVVSAIVLSIIQIPIAHFIIHSYKLTTELHDMARTYAIAMLISMPFTLISTVGACQFQEIGKMKVLMIVAIIESAINLTLDILLVGTFRMGVFGAGLATAIAAVVRSTLTVIYFLTKTNIYNKYGVKVKMNEVKRIISVGFSYSVSILTIALHGYLMLRVILHVFGEDGATINAVCYFCMSIATVFISSSADANGPLNGIFESICDRVAARNALRISMMQVIIAVGAFTLLIELRPECFYFINGIKDIPSLGTESLRIYALCLVFHGINILFDGYYIDKNYALWSARLTLYGDIATPIVAFILFKFIGKVYLWYAEIILEGLILIVYIVRYAYIVYNQIKKEKMSMDILYLEVKPSKAVEASKDLLQYAEEKNYPKDLSNDVALCMEEMVNYAVKTQNNIGVHIQIMINFFKYGATFVMLDDGERLNLNENEDQDKIITNNYELLKKMAKTYKYQYLLNMNHTVFEF